MKLTDGKSLNQDDDLVFSVTTIWEGTSDSSIFLVSVNKLREGGYDPMADELEKYVGRRGVWADFERPTSAYEILNECQTDKEAPLEIAGAIFGYLG